MNPKLEGWLFFEANQSSKSINKNIFNERAQLRILMPTRSSENCTKGYRYLFLCNQEREVRVSGSVRLWDGENKLGHPRRMRLEVVA